MALTVEQIDQALENIALTGQSYSRPGLTVTHASYDSLMKMRSKLIAEANAGGDNGRMIASDFNSDDGCCGDDFDCGGC